MNANSGPNADAGPGTDASPDAHAGFSCVFCSCAAVHAFALQPPGGNQVDGLPPAPVFGVGRGPRTFMILAIGNLLLVLFLKAVTSFVHSPTSIDDNTSLSLSMGFRSVG